MRKVTREVVTAFVNGRRKTVTNTSSDGTILTLHGNIIAYKDGDGSITATLAGWNTPTTRERLNGLCELLGLGRPYHQKQYEPHFNGKPIDSRETVVLVGPSVQPAE